MLELILCALGLLIVQIMAHYPMNLQHVQFFLSNRHGEIEYSETTLRIQRAAANLKETLPIFLTLMILGMVQGVDLTLLGACWLGLRVAFFILYSLGIEKVRSVVWILALIVLAVMGSTLLSAL
ncbi:MAG: MAPEG family protein [Pseudohongiellaceae bacterium]|jgi:Predicted membrane protein